MCKTRPVTSPKKPKRQIGKKELPMGYDNFTGPGRIDDDSWIDQPDPPLLATLYNYDVESAQPKKEHLGWLEENAIPFLKKHRDWLISIDGMASASGPHSLNRLLAERR